MLQQQERIPQLPPLQHPRRRRRRRRRPPLPLGLRNNSNYRYPPC